MSLWDDTNTLALLIAGAFAAGLVNGLAGFGTALFALGFWLQAMPPSQAVAMSLVVAVITGLQGLWIVRHAIFAQQRRLFRFAAPSIFGIPLGIVALKWVQPEVLRLTIAGFMILYGAFFLGRRKLHAIDRPTPAIDVGVGFAGGFLGGFAGLSGALPAMWCGLRSWPRSETRAVLQPYNFAVLSISAGILALRGVYTPQTLQALAIAVPVSLIAAQAGLALFRRIGDQSFRWLLIVLMFLSGISLLARELL